MEFPRILYIGNKLASAGRTVTSIETLGELLKGEGFTVHMASSKKNKIVRMLDMMWSVYKCRKQVSFVLIDTYSTQNFYFAVAVAKVCRLFRLSYIPILRGGALPKRIERSRRLSWKLFNGAHKNVAPSEYLLRAFQNAGFSNLIHIPNSIELVKYEYRDRELITGRLLWVRAFAGIYNPELALEVVQLLISYGVEVELTMVGPDKDGSLEKCKELAVERKLPVTFTGKLEKSEWIAMAKDFDIFINTTNFDNMPVSVIEAMALGLPVVTTEVGGIPFLAKHEKNALLVEPGNASTFSKAVLRLINDNGQARRQAKNARSMVENFDWKVVKHSWFELLKA